MRSLYFRIYAMPLAAIPVWIILLLAVWAVLAGWAEDAGREKYWIRLNRILLAVFILVIIGRTLLSRSAGTYSAEWHFFGKLKAAATVQPEYYREMLMNLFLFVPFGLFAPFALKKPGRGEKPARQIQRIILIGLLFSCLIELLQLAFSIGLPEAEDVICNTIGTAIGTAAFLLWSKNPQIRKRFLGS